MTNVVVKLQVEGLHRWQGCNIKEVIYLINEHRHIFHIVCKKEVSHDDRDIEIITLKHQILKYLHNAYGNEVCTFGSRSCEMIARELLEKFSLNYCSVLEDNENGAEVTA